MNGTERIAVCRLRLASPLFMEDESEQSVDIWLSVFVAMFLVSGTALLFWPIGWRSRGLALIAGLSLLNWKLDATTLFWKLEGVLLALIIDLALRCGPLLFVWRNSILVTAAVALLLSDNISLFIVASSLLALSVVITAILKRKKLAIVHFAGAQQLKRQREAEQRLLAQGFSLASATVEKILLPSGVPSSVCLGWTADHVQISTRDGKEQPVLEFSPAEDMVVFYSVANSFLKQTFVAYYYGGKKCTFPPFPLQEYQKKSYRCGSTVMRSFFYSAGQIQELPPPATKFLAQCMGPRQAPRSGGASPNSSPTAAASSPIDSLLDAHFGHAWTFQRLVHFGVLKPTEERKETKTDEENEEMPDSFLLQLITTDSEKSQIEAQEEADEKKDETKEDGSSVPLSATERFLVTEPEPEGGVSRHEPLSTMVPSDSPTPPSSVPLPCPCPAPCTPLSVRPPSPTAHHAEGNVDAKRERDEFVTLGSPIWQDQFLYRSRRVRSSTSDPVAKQFMQRYRQISAPSYIAAHGRAGVLVQISSTSKEILAIPGR